MQVDENKRYTLKEMDNFNYGIRVIDVIMDNDIELPQSTVCNLLNEQEEEIQRLESELELYRHYVEFVPSSGDMK